MTLAPSLRGARVAVLEARMGEELASLVERWSGVPYCVPLLREVERGRPEEIAAAIDWLGAGPKRLVVFLNGKGVDAVFRIAGELGREAELRAGLERAELVCRGPKPSAALKKRALAPTVRVAEPFTTSEVLDALRTTLAERPVTEALVVHYGERNDAVVAVLRGAQAKVRELSLYDWELPEDLTAVFRLLDEIVERRVSVVAFTSQIQARHLMAVAERVHKAKDLQRALTTHTLVAAIGPTSAEMLRSLGIPPHIVPESPKMGPMVQSIARFLSERGRTTPPVSVRGAQP